MSRKLLDVLKNIIFTKSSLLYIYIYVCIQWIRMRIRNILNPLSRVDILEYVKNPE